MPLSDIQPLAKPVKYIAKPRALRMGPDDAYRALGTVAAKLVQDERGYHLLTRDTSGQYRRIAASVAPGLRRCFNKEDGLQADKEWLFRFYPRSAHKTTSKGREVRFPLLYVFAANEVDEEVTPGFTITGILRRVSVHKNGVSGSAIVEVPRNIGTSGNRYSGPNLIFLPDAEEFKFAKIGTAITLEGFINGSLLEMKSFKVLGVPKLARSRKKMQADQKIIDEKRKRKAG